MAVSTLPRARTGRSGSIVSARKALWEGIVRCKAVLLSAQDTQSLVSACHAMSQAVSVYSKLVEQAELDARLKALEARQNELEERR